MKLGPESALQQVWSPSCRCDAVSSNVLQQLKGGIASHRRHQECGGALRFRVGSTTLTLGHRHLDARFGADTGLLLSFIHHTSFVSGLVVVVVVD